MGTLGFLRDRARLTLRWSLAQGLPRLLVARAARNGDPQAMLISDAAVRDDPYPTLEAIRAKGPLVRGRLTFITCSHAVVREVLRSDDMGAGFNPDALPGVVRKLADWAKDERTNGPLDPPSLLAVEPPDHTRYRTLVAKVFTARAVARLRERTEEITAELLDELEASAAGPTAPTDLIERFATLLPVTVIAEILGVPASERARVLRFGAGAAPSLDLGSATANPPACRRASPTSTHGWAGTSPPWPPIPATTF